MSAHTDHAREIKYALADVRAVCERLGLLADRKRVQRQASGFIVPCPSHGGASCSVTRGPDGTVRVRCFGCDLSGDVLTLVAAVRGLDTRRHFREVLLEAAELGSLWQIVDEIRRGEARVDRPERVAPPAPVAEPPREYPPIAEVLGLLGACASVTDDAEVSAWLRGRGLDPELVAADDLARALPRDARAPRWASYQRRAWTETGHRLIVPMRDAGGEIRSVRAGRVVDGDTPKRLPPGGHKASGVVMVCPLGVAMLRAQVALEEVVVVEGEPDFLTWATRATPRPTARIGLVSGGWTAAHAARMPVGATVHIWTDHDPAGDKYAREVVESLRRRCFVRREGGGRAA